MKKYLVYILVCAIAPCFTSCNNKRESKEAKQPRIKNSFMRPQSSGTPYEIMVIMDKKQWEEEPVGRALFNVLDTDVPGLPQSERSFRISRIQPEYFNRTFHGFRNIIMLDIQDIYTQPKFKFTRDVYSAPQMIMTLQSPSKQELAEYLEKNGQAIIDFFTKAEMNREIVNLREQHNMEVSAKTLEIFDADIWVPLELNRYKTGKDFFWASTNRGEKDLNIVLYSYPYTDKNTFTLEYFLQKRDSVMKANIPGGPEGSYMTTNHDFVTVKDGTVRNQYAQIARGLWRVKGDRMGGPFVSHSRVDEQNGRVIVAEAFVYAPETQKRNLIRKLEAALYTLHMPGEGSVNDMLYGLEEIVIEPDFSK